MSDIDSLGHRCVERIRAHLSAACLRWQNLNGEAVAKLIDEQIASEGIPEKLKRAAKRAAFTPPTPAQVEAYSHEIGYPMDGRAWCDHYELKRWCVSGSTRMVSWQAAVRKWKSMGWLPTKANGVQVNGRSSSEDALKGELRACEQALHGLLYPGGCAWKAKMEGDNLVRYDALQKQRSELKQRIAAYQSGYDLTNIQDDRQPKS